ncbi:competence type IV pilus minor pilin ComGD [Enterococcus columbae]|uniref:Prepilin-type N-terminal cleavage/methylation domain-containing protein n=1 Tax=Enterococcus columbae DSM 7374 = ATCC 51263 TaxID=1121865 RepID=S0JZ79_9ENTE|nr:competence type IV pilus minor pilin ComGD [Enterococcus columbae]EOT38179.1 hypothetical protein OMW_02293 [Enterococcus columbae DSM 7374 = ATCC 51263]EOW83704.1 hypothetical protein I568_01505 [Enterococcus columbae DSM 7374 = ATCC 51263]
MFKMNTPYLSKSSVAGFTLIELLCVLFIVSLVSTIGLHGFLGLKARVEQQVFFQTFENNLAYIHERAIIGGTAAYIHSRQDYIAIDFPYDGKAQEILYAPSSIKVITINDLTFHQYTGTYGPISSFDFVDTLANQRITYQLFLGSGRYEKRITPIVHAT